MGQSLADITGVATIKTLVACLGLPDFTVDELASESGLPRSTVDTVLRRYIHAFERRPAARHAGPGRPPGRWRLRIEYLDEIAAAVEWRQSVFSNTARSRERTDAATADAEASLVLAAVAIARPADDPAEAAQLVAAARHSLSAAGFNADGSPRAGQPGPDVSGRARLVAAVTDVVAACITTDQRRIDEAQARAMPHVVAAKQYLRASEWLPLAQRVLLAPGTVLSAPVFVNKDMTAYFNGLFPSLRRRPDQDAVRPGFVCLSDARAEISPSLIPATFLLRSRDPAAARQELARIADPANLVMVSSSPEVLKPAIERGAHFILQQDAAATKVSIANVVNWRACGLR